MRIIPADIKSQQKYYRFFKHIKEEVVLLTKHQCNIRVEEGRKHKGTLDINRIFSDDAKKSNGTDCVAFRVCQSNNFSILFQEDKQIA